MNAQYILKLTKYHKPVAWCILGIKLHYTDGFFITASSRDVKNAAAARALYNLYVFMEGAEAKTHFLLKELFQKASKSMALNEVVLYIFHKLKIWTLFCT